MHLFGIWFLFFPLILLLRFASVVVRMTYTEQRQSETSEGEKERKKDHAVCRRLTESALTATNRLEVVAAICARTHMHVPYVVRASR